MLRSNEEETQIPVEKGPPVEEVWGNPFGNISPVNWSSLCDLFVMESIKKCRDRHENFKASRAYIVRFKGHQRFQGHMLPVSRDEKSIYT
ncbi:hypothetical protein C5167_035435 [Papaver somniferum]|uniref:Uncharacterized protein n=1 Tax=Papaver somniferum TaxID=3469 RepID=A0A4Y7KIU4_PAPSO|nr:hypothetical protein C5167_035435 [Papaver somniferum]